MVRYKLLETQRKSAFEMILIPKLNIYVIPRIQRTIDPVSKDAQEKFSSSFTTRGAEHLIFKTMKHMNCWRFN